LLAANIALYADDPRGALNMRFTYDLWKHRVLPHGDRSWGKTAVGTREANISALVSARRFIKHRPCGAALPVKIFSEPSPHSAIPEFITTENVRMERFPLGDAGFFNRIVPDSCHWH